MQLPAIRSAKKMGWTVIVADRNPDVPGASMCDRFLPVDISDCDRVFAAATGPACDHLHGVFTAGTDFSATVAFVAGKLGLPGIPYEVALDASDKSRMRSVFKKRGLPSPEFCTVTTVEECRAGEGGIEGLSFPLVVKPVDNMGARGVRRVDTPRQLTEAVQDALEFSRNSTVIVETYIDGPEFSLDALVYNGEITLCGIADRDIRFPPYFVETGHTMPSAMSETITDGVRSLFFEGIRALGIDNGAAKGDIKYGPDGPVIGEIAARLSGGYMSGWTFPFASGVDVTTAALRIAVGLEPGNLDPRIANTSVERAFYSIPGTVADISGFPDVIHGPLSEGFLRIRPGSDVDFPFNNVQKCGNIIATSEEREVAIEAAEKACRQVVIRLEPVVEATQKFLTGETHTWVPDAFSIDVKLRAALAQMPDEFPGESDSDTDLSIHPFEAIAGGSGTDWLGRSIADSMTIVQELTGVKTGLSGRKILGSLFWRAMIRGGVQGAIWLIDTVQQFQI